ncbi:hypothetical protein [Kineosporia succinea]|uniref:Secreted protein n=1 Tax=Kineosporia succinea TaxID=84632 RepID=A0ABT9NX64_9ACTN|nr:hypothetical protein [Kineosporia succinea]MDP9824852.1 hypothetical protein [Kineosporia succinea]
MKTLDLVPETDGPADDPPSSPARLCLYVLGTVSVTLLGSVVVGTADAPRHDAVPSPTPFATAVQIDEAPVSLREVCPVRTDHRNQLTVTFALANTDASIVLVSKISSPAVGALRQLGVTRAGGDCAKPGRKGAKAVIRPRATRFYTVRWNLPDSCPERYPLRARVTYLSPDDDKPRKSDVRLLPDLGGIGFVQCPTARTEFPQAEP